MKSNQRTIRNPVELDGKGLFSGIPVRLRLRPAPAERLSLAPDCGLGQTARWAARQKLGNMVAGVHVVRRELGL